jgi:large conductance mechanosensitive channel
MFDEFKQFAMRGPVLDLAIGVVIGAAFGKIVASLVADVIMPPIGLFTGGIDFTNLFIDLSGRGFESLAAARAAGAATINYGVFLNTIVEFIIIAFVLFLLVRQVNRMRQPAPAAPATKDCPMCLMAVNLKARRCPHCTSELA